MSPILYEKCKKFNKYAMAPCVDPNGDKISHAPASATSNQAFARGWSSLPDELKLEILAHVLVKGTAHVDNFSIQYLKKNSTIGGCLFASRQLHQMAIDVLYKRNTFDLSRSRISGIFRHPKPCINHLIRRIKLGIDLNPADWRFLQRIANGTLGFPNLQEVAVMVYTDSILVRSCAHSLPRRISDSRGRLMAFKSEVESQAVTFTTSKLVVRYEQNLVQWDCMHVLSPLFDEVEQLVFDQLTAVSRITGTPLEDTWDFKKRSMIRISGK